MIQSNIVTGEADADIMADLTRTRDTIHNFFIHNLPQASFLNIIIKVCLYICAYQINGALCIVEYFVLMTSANQCIVQALISI